MKIFDFQPWLNGHDAPEPSLSQLAFEFFRQQLEDQGHHFCEVKVSSRVQWFLSNFSYSFSAKLITQNDSRLLNSFGEPMAITPALLVKRHFQAKDPAHWERLRAEYASIVHSKWLAPFAIVLTNHQSVPISVQVVDGGEIAAMARLGEVFDGNPSMVRSKEDAMRLWHWSTPQGTWALATVSE